MKQRHGHGAAVRKDRSVGKLPLDNLGVIIRCLERFGPMSEGGRTMIERCTGTREHMPNSVILREGDRLVPLWFVAGWACRQRFLDDGRRQIINFVLPGDGIGFHNQSALTASCGIVSLTAVRTVDGAALAQALEDPSHNDVKDALERQYAVEESMLCDQIVRLGRRSALERVAHLLLELNSRLVNVGLATGDRFELPLTQEILADAVGLSIVHVNRTLQQLRRAGTVELRSGYVRVLDPAAMRAIANSRA